MTPRLLSYIEQSLVIHRGLLCMGTGEKSLSIWMNTALLSRTLLKNCCFGGQYPLPSSPLAVFLKEARMATWSWGSFTLSHFLPLFTIAFSLYCILWTQSSMWQYLDHCLYISSYFVRGFFNFPKVAMGKWRKYKMQENFWNILVGNKTSLQILGKGN